MTKTLDGVLSGNYDAIVVGSGFGASVAITMLAERGKSVLVLERGTWWGNPEGPAQKAGKGQGKKQDFKALGTDKRQWWPRPNDAKGVNYMLASIYKETNPVADFFNPFLKDRDAGLKKNRRGLYRVTCFSHDNGKVDVVSGSGVGGGSLFYSGVNLRPKQDVLDRIGLGHLGDTEFDRAGRWMQTYRGRINKLATLVPVPQHRGDSYRLRNDPAGSYGPEYEMPDPNVPKHEDDTLLLARSRILRDARHAAEDDLSAEGGEAEAWHPLPLSMVEYDPSSFDEGPHDVNAGDNAPHRANTTLAQGVSKADEEIELASVTDLPLDDKQEFSLLITGDDGPSEIVTVLEHLGGTRFRVARGTWHSNSQKHSAGAQVQHLRRSDSAKKNSFCLREGRCMVGCLPSARHTLYKTIQILVERGLKVEVVPQTKVSHVTAADDGYEVHFETFLNDSDGERRSKRCKRVFFGAGVLGTNEILLRSREKGLPLPERVGHGFSTNGDFFAFALRVDRKSKKKRKKVNPTVGPINASGFDVNFEAEQIHVNVEDAGIPSMFARFIRAIIPGALNLSTLLRLAKAAYRSQLLGRDPFDSSADPITTKQEQPEYLTERELLSDLFFFNSQGAGPDEPLGTFSLDNDGSGLKLAYEDGKELHKWPVFERSIKTLQILAKHMNTEADDFVISPFFREEGRLATVHPLGGCTVGADRTQGTVDTYGRIFDGSPAAPPTTVLDGLYVVDASTVPGAIGVNPTLTFVTQAVRTVEKALAEID